MKVIQTITDVEKEGLEALLGDTVIIYCINYIYHGKLVGVNKTCIKLENPSIIYETGSFDAKTYSDIQSLHVKHHYIQTQSIESFGKANK
jgi:hypothetical protein